MKRHLYEHFTLPGHSGFLHDVSVTLIDKIDPSCPTKLKDYWIDTLKTKAPIGRNLMIVSILFGIFTFLHLDLNGFVSGLCILG